MKDRTLTLINDDGTETISDILFTYHYSVTNKDYVIFQVRENGVVSAMTYEEETLTSGKLGKVETDEEWDMLEKLLDDYQQDLDDESCDGECEGCDGCDE